MVGIIIIGNVGAVGMIHVFVTLIIIIVAADQVLIACRFDAAFAGRA
ncbi:hypothetical protein [Mesorhizobium sp. M1322]